MPLPPACWTTWLFSIRALTPRSQTTILPLTFAGSSVPGKQRATEAAGAPAAPAADERTTEPVVGVVFDDAPVYDAPLPSVSVASEARACVLAATVVSHGPGCATVEAPGPSLPAEAATNTPARAAKRNATSTGSRKLVLEPLIEKLITSTPSATAWSIAAMLSELAHPPASPFQQTLYAAMRARGAMPLILPSGAAAP